MNFSFSFLFPLHIWLLFSYIYFSFILSLSLKRIILSRCMFLLSSLLFIVCLSIATLYIPMPESSYNNNNNWQDSVFHQVSSLQLFSAFFFANQCKHTVNYYWCSFIQLGVMAMLKNCRLCTLSKFSISLSFL